MKVKDLALSGLKLVELDVFGDSRGFFVERFHAEKFRALGLPTEFVQDNHSRSAPGVLRGLHYQCRPEQGKLVGCVQGRIWDVAVDLRPESLTFGKHFSVELTDTNGLLVWIPPGFAHGFCVLGDEPAAVLYKVTEPYNPAGEGGIRWNDRDLNIPWPLREPKVSARDGELPSFAEYCGNPVRLGG
jgi:dTDP-4-dehydrorhamnose 3,5-epimerase